MIGLLDMVPAKELGIVPLDTKSGLTGAGRSRLRSLPHAKAIVLEKNSIHYLNKIDLTREQK